MSCTSKRTALADAATPAPYSDSLPSLKCRGQPVFRSKVVRDVACILDLNPDIAKWYTPAPGPAAGALPHTPDFQVFNRDGTVRFVDAPDRQVAVSDVELLSSVLGQRASYRRMSSEELYDGFRVQNARDLLQYANVQVTLADRLRLLAVLDQEGSLTMSDCFGIIRYGEPVAVVASMILHGFLDVDLDEKLISPETFVRRIRA
jgi:hypothetical protein